VTLPTIQHVILPVYDHGVGVRPVRTYELRRVDTGYFDEQA
jgi:restriction endonuclease Mrr